MKTIVLGYDDSESAQRALGRVIQLVKAFDASVVAISAAQVLARATHGMGPIDPVDSPDLHREQLDHVRAVLDGLGIEASYDVGIGDPADVIIAAAEERDADMIVVGTSEPGLIEAPRPERQRESPAARALRRADRPLIGAADPSGDALQLAAAADARGALLAFVHLDAHRLMATTSAPERT